MRATEEAVNKFLHTTLIHVNGMHYVLERLFGYTINDPELPHDLVGPGNKREPMIIDGFSHEYMKETPGWQEAISKSLARHRMQQHHRMWNGPDPNDPSKPAPNATIDGLILGATDQIRALRENRNYNGGSHSYSEIRQYIESEDTPLHKRPWLLQVLPLLEKMEQPRTDRIISIHSFPNIGIRPAIYEAIKELMQETIQFLRNEEKYILSPDYSHKKTTLTPPRAQTF